MILCDPVNRVHPVELLGNSFRHNDPEAALSAHVVKTALIIHRLRRSEVGEQIADFLVLEFL